MERLVRITIAVVYCLLYGCSVWYASTRPDAPGGGMQWIFTIILGAPWNLLAFSILFLSPLEGYTHNAIVRSLAPFLVWVLPPLINVYLILKTRGVFFAFPNIEGRTSRKSGMQE